MSRKRQAERRDVAPDSKYNSRQLSKFINKIMIGGKKSTAQRIVYAAIEELGQKVNEAPLDAFNKAIKNAIPLMEVKSRRVGGSTYQVPMEVKTDRGIALSMRWIIGNSRNRSGKSMTDKLANELLDAYQNTGSSIKKREDTHKMAEANKAFAHFRW